VICSDIARYSTASTAELTQGAGAAALLVQNRPRLLELDLRTQGFFSDDVDDFFRPLGSQVARVKGGYSMHCYLRALESAFLDHCANLESEPAHVLEETDLFVLHAPFRNMPQLAMKKLLGRHLGLSAGAAEEFLTVRGLPASVEPVSRIGNIYSGSLYLGLAFLLADRYRELGEQLVGKRILLVSYGSGNTMIVVAGRVAGEAPEVISRWDLDQIWRQEQTGLNQHYENWVSGPYGPEEYHGLLNGHAKEVPEGSYFLSSIREDGYREYAYK
jgi:hydroxymethylglutaryl-CoA synthase